MFKFDENFRYSLNLHLSKFFYFNLDPGGSDPSEGFVEMDFKYFCCTNKLNRLKHSLNHLAPSGGDQGSGRGRFSLRYRFLTNNIVIFF